MNKNLCEKIVLITGASRGLGQSIARSYWENGATLYLVARSSNELKKISEELLQEKYHNTQEITLLPGDITNEFFLKAIKNKIEQKHNKLDILVNNAAIHGPIGALEENDWSLWKKTFDVDLFAAVFLTKIFTPLLKRSIRGKVINISGGGATNSRPNFSAYATAKTALLRFTEILSEELKDFVDVNAIAPGVMNTQLLAEILKKGEDKAGKKDFTAATAMTQQSGDDESMRLATQLALFLASEKSNGITGKLISAKWDNWRNFDKHRDELAHTDIYTLRRIVPKDRGMEWE